MNLIKWLSLFVSRFLVLEGVRERTVSSNRQNNAIKIGIIASLTGEESNFGQSVKNAVDLAVENYNVQGGVLGKKIETIVYDDKADPSEAVLAFEKLVNNDKVNAVIGGGISATALPIAPLAAKYNIPMITPTAKHPDITKGYKPVFRAGFTTEYEARGLAQFAYNKLNARKAAVLYDISNIYSTELAENFKTAFEAVGGSVTSYQAHPHGTEDFSPYLENIKMDNPDVLFIPNYYQLTALILKQVKESGLDVIPLGADGWDGWERMESGREFFEGAYFSNDYAEEDPAPQNKNFIAAYRKKYRQVPNASAALGYDSAVILFEGMKKAATTEANSVIERLEAIHFQGVTGDIHFDKEHNPQKPIYMFQIQNGKANLIQKIRPLRGNVLNTDMIKLGVIAPITGEEAEYGQSVQNGIELAVDTYNQQGGILGEKIKTIVYDDQGNPDASVQLFEKLATEDQANAVIGGLTSPTALPIAPLSAKYNLPMITPLATHANITNGYKSVFRMNSTIQNLGRALAHFAYDQLNARKVGIMFDLTNIYSTELAEEFKKAFEAKGGRIVSYEGYAKGTTDFSPYLKKIKTSSSDVIFIPDYYNPAALILEQAKELGINVVTLGGTSWFYRDAVSGVEDVFEGNYFTDSYALDEPSFINKNFITAYKKKYNKDPNALSALGYDSTVVMLEAMKKAGTIKSDKVIEWLEATNLQGVTGQIKFDKDHNPLKLMYIFKIQNGKNNLIQKIRPK